MPAVFALYDQSVARLQPARPVTLEHLRVLAEAHPAFQAALQAAQHVASLDPESGAIPERVVALATPAPGAGACMEHLQPGDPVAFALALVLAEGWGVTLQAQLGPSGGVAWVARVADNGRATRHSGVCWDSDPHPSTEAALRESLGLIAPYLPQPVTVQVCWALLR